MKLYEIQHINQDHNPNKQMGEELRFVSQVSNISEKFYPAEKQPKDYDHVRRLTHMLFLAWNDSNPLEGTVYLGEFYNPESEDEKFYRFFEEFNKFPINETQKSMYHRIKKGWHTIGGRRCGATTLLLTIAAYEAAINDKFVVYLAHTEYTATLYNIEFHNKMYHTQFVFNLKKVQFRTCMTDMNIFRGHSNVRVIFDNIGYCKFFKYGQYKNITKPIRDFKQFSIDTF